MSKKDLFTALLKLIGFYTFFTYLISLLNTVFYTIVQEGASFSEQKIEIGYYLIFIVSALGLMLFAEKIVGIFRLNKGYERDFIALDNMKGVDIVKVGVFVLGVMLIVSNLSYVILWIIQRFATAVRNGNMLPFDIYSSFTAFANLILGFLMITNFGRIAKWFVKWNNEGD